VWSRVVLRIAHPPNLSISGAGWGYQISEPFELHRVVGHVEFFLVSDI